MLKKNYDFSEVTFVKSYINCRGVRNSIPLLIKFIAILDPGHTVTKNF